MEPEHQGRYADIGRNRCPHLTVSSARGHPAGAARCHTQLGESRSQPSSSRASVGIRLPPECMKGCAAITAKYDALAKPLVSMSDHGQDPLPAAPAIDEAGPEPARDPDLLHRQGPASNNIARGWTRLTGLAPIMLWLACLLAVRNQRILDAWDARQADDASRAAAGATQDPPPAPQDPHRPGHRRHPALTRPDPAQPRQGARSPAPPGPRHPGQHPARKHSGGHAAARKPPKTATHAERQTQNQREDKSRSNVKTLWRGPHVGGRITAGRRDCGI